MDYSGILKRAWQLTWKYKVLWLFGLFAGGMGGGYSGSNSNSNFGSGSRSGSGSSGFPFGSQAQFNQLLERSLPLVIAVGILLVVIGIVWWVLSVAARGGIVHLVNEAESGRTVSASDGWSVGFAKWGRVFLIRLVVSLPLIVLALIMGVIVAIGVVGAVGGASRSGSGMAGAEGAILAALSGMCCLLAVFVIVAIVLGVVVVIVSELAVRYGVLEDRGVMDSVRAGWADLRAKRGAFVMYLVQWAVSIVFSILIVVASLVAVVPAILLIATGAWPIGVFIIMVFGLVMLLPAAIYGAFYQAAWTIFFRRMTGMEPKAAAAVPYGGYPSSPAAPSAFPPPPQPAPAPGQPAPVPPAPPAPWEQPGSGAPSGAAVDPWKAANGLPPEPAPPGEPPAGV